MASILNDLTKMAKKENNYLEKYFRTFYVRSVKHQKNENRKKTEIHRNV